MRIPGSVALLAALSLPLTSGCNTRIGEQQSEEYNKAIKAKENELSDSIVPLDHIRNRINGIQLFDLNKDQILNPAELDLFIKVWVNGGSSIHTEEGRKKLSSVIDELNIIFVSFEEINGSKTPIEYHPKNLVRTVENLRAKWFEYEEVRLNQIDAKIQLQLGNELKHQ